MADTTYIAMWSNGVSSYMPLSSFMTLTAGLDAKFSSLSTPAGKIVPGPSLQTYSATAATLAAISANTAKASIALDTIEARIVALERRGLHEFSPEFAPEFD